MSGVIRDEDIERARQIWRYLDPDKPLTKWPVLLWRCPDGHYNSASKGDITFRPTKKGWECGDPNGFRREGGSPSEAFYKFLSALEKELGEERAKLDELLPKRGA